MCFGSDSTKTEKTSSTSTTSVPEWLTNSGQSNLDYASSLRDKGYQYYTGPTVANFSNQQQSSFDQAGKIADSVNTGEIGGLTRNYANAGAGSVNAGSIASNMSPYLNQYVNYALQPQLQMQDESFNRQNKAVDSAATMAGAFGDTGWGQMRGTTTQAQNAARMGLIGQAYNSAFNTAIGAGAQDASNNLSAQTTNQNLRETALNRNLTGANALQSQQTSAAELANKYGSQQTAQEQAQLTSDYDQFKADQNYDLQTTQLVDQAIAAAKTAAPTTTDSSGTKTTTQPDNSGYGLLGTIASAGLGLATGGASLPFTSALTGMLGSGSQGGNGLSTDVAQNGSGIYTGDASYPGFAADGGKIKAGKPVVVGERGPELIVPGADALVIPNEILRAAKEKRAAALKKLKGKAKPAPTKFGIAA